MKSLYSTNPIVLVVLVVSIGCLSIYATVSVWISENMQIFHDLSDRDVVVVLGARSYRDGAYNPCLVSRVQTAIDLDIPVHLPIIFSGGVDREDGAIEAEVMKEIWIQKTTASNTIYTESTSTSTYENIVYTKTLMEKMGWRKLGIVTANYHLPRAVAVAKQLGIDVKGYPDDQNPCWSRWKYFSRYYVREVFAVIQYKLNGWI